MKSSVRDIMTTDVVAVRASASFKEIAAKLREHRVSAIPVLDETGTVIGVVSEADLLLKEAFEEEPGIPGVAHGILIRRDREKAEGITAADLMSSPAVTVDPGDSVEHAARLMYARRVKRIPVTDAAGQLIGMVSRADVLSIFDRPDEEIRLEILDRIADELGADPNAIGLTVEDGIVTVQGRPESASLGRDIITRIRHVEGVVSVRDRLSYPKP
jgi:CBS domain-containing protein